MNHLRTHAGCLLVIAGALPAIAQERPKDGSAPLYTVTVTDRSVDAVNYQYRSGPTRIDFRGTVLLSNGKGDATVESRQGRTDVDARFDNLVAPTRFGREYLTYVLWAISPEGAPHNLGEIVPDSGNHGRMRVTTGLQAFGLIVTAEPYAAVHQPSDVVVLENEVRPDTIGRIQPIRVRYELMPRGHYTWNKDSGLAAAVENAPKVSMSEYEALLQLYQAQNAIGVARAANADQYAPETFAKATQLFEESQRLRSTKGNWSLIVQNAREAAQTAEDARVIAERRRQDDQIAKAQSEVLAARQAQAQAEAAAQRAREEADAIRAQAEADRVARQQSEGAHASVPEPEPAPAPEPPAAAPPPPEPSRVSDQRAQTGIRLQLMEQLSAIVTTRDTPRGLVVTIPDSNFSGASLRPEASQNLAKVAALLAGQPGLRVTVEGHTDSIETEPGAERRAAAVRSALVGGGLPANAVTSQGLGTSNLLTSNATAAGRTENRRVEIVITGGSVGNRAYWDRSYQLNLQK